MHVPSPGGKIRRGSLYVEAFHLVGRPLSPCHTTFTFSSRTPLPASPEPPEAFTGLVKIGIAIPLNCSREGLPVGLAVLVRTAPSGVRVEGAAGLCMGDPPKERVMSKSGAILEIYPQVLMAWDPDIGAGVAAELLGNAKAAEVFGGLFLSLDPLARSTHNREAAQWRLCTIALS